VKVGDVVMYVDEGCYAKWFWGCLATVISYAPTHPNDTRHASCRVKWMVPLKYYESVTSVSDFSATHFEVISENR
jgi:hypothetical protein